MKETDHKWRLLLSGAAAGLINGLFGAGGGMVLVPLLTFWCHMEDRKAFASALSVMLPISLISLCIYWLSSPPPFAASVPFLLCGTVGGIAAGIFYRKIPTGLLHKAMGLLIIWGGIRLLL